MSLSIFKPNKSNKGAFLNINFSAKADKISGKEVEKGDKSFYFKIIGQTSWNDKNKTGGFKDGPSIVAKMSVTEIAGMLYAIKNNVSLNEAMGVEYVYHDGSNSATIVVFSPIFERVKRGNEWVQTEKQKGYGLRLTKKNKSNTEDKLSLGIGFTFAELELLVRFLEDGLGHIFNAMYSEEFSRFKRKASKEDGGPVPSNGDELSEENTEDAPPSDEEDFEF